MFNDKIFRITFLISLIAHGVMFLQNPHMLLFKQDTRAKNIEVNYINSLRELKERRLDNIIKRESLAKTSSKITAEKRTPPPFVDKEDMFRKNQTIYPRERIFTKPTLIRPDIIAVKKIINLPPVDLDKINNPSYISYYQIVREKIKRCAYQNYTRTDVGEVYLSFIIADNGVLKGVRLAEERSSQNPYLKEIALKSINDAAPFPQFPKDLDYPQLTFNVVISFEIE